MSTKSDMGVTRVASHGLLCFFYSLLAQFSLFANWTFVQLHKSPRTWWGQLDHNCSDFCARAYQTPMLFGPINPLHRLNPFPI